MALERDRARGVEKQRMRASQLPSADRTEPTVRRTKGSSDPTAPHAGVTAPTAPQAGVTAPTARRIQGLRNHAAAPDRTEAPLVLDRYRLTRRLGTGGFGTVWQARDERLHRNVAVKLLPRERISGGRFDREARAAARLAHPGIVTLYEAAVDEEGAYLVSELVQGATLARLLADGRLSDRGILNIAVALCDALEHAHSEGVVHRDVKPSNILIPRRPSTPAEVAKLTDFGVARLAGGNPLTRTGDVIGTVAYMAPEQAAGRAAERPADLYSLALVIYEALTGVNPLATSTAAQRARRPGAYLPPLRRQRRDLPRALGQGIDLALRPRPSERGTVAALKGALLLAAEQVDDRPGVVTGGSWRTRAGEDSEDDFEAGSEDGYEERYPAWVARALGAATAAGATAWVATHLLAPSPLAPLAAALLAGILIAALPRIGWLALIGAITTTLATQHRPGAALLLAIAALVPVVAMLRHPTDWPLPAAAPLLGAISLAGAWPALAAKAGGPWRRAALAATGWISLVVIAPLTDRGLYPKLAPAVAAPAHWMGSLPATAHHVLSPLLSSGVLLAAPLWAAAAVVLPLIRAGGSRALDVVLVVLWAVVVAVLTAALAGPIMAANGILGAVAAGVIVLAPNVTKGWSSGVIRRTRGANLRSMDLS